MSIQRPCYGLALPQIPLRVGNPGLLSALEGLVIHLALGLTLYAPLFRPSARVTLGNDIMLD